MKPSYFCCVCLYSQVWSGNWRDTSAHAQRNHLTAERRRFAARLWHRAGRGPSPWGATLTRLQPSGIRGVSVGNSSPGVWRFAHGVSPHEMQPAADWVRLFESLARCMALPGKAMNIRRADWKAAAPRYQRHGGGEKWIPLESASGSVYEDPRRAGRLCRTMDFSRLRNIIRRYVRAPGFLTTVTTVPASVWKFGSLVYACKCTKLPPVTWW